MQIHQTIRDTMKLHKGKIEILQWAVISGISSLIYSEYCKNMKNKVHPVRQIMVPEINSIREILNPDGEFIDHISNHLLDEMSKHDTIQQYLDVEELVLFKPENIEILKTIFDLYIIPNIVQAIPNTIQRKFAIGDPKNQIFREDRTIDMFSRKFEISGNFSMWNFIIDQTVLQLLMLLQTVDKSVEVPEDNMHILMTKNEILTITHENAICQIHFDKNIFANESIMKLLSWITSTSVHMYSDNDEVAAFKNNRIVSYNVSTNVFNQVALTTITPN